MLLQDVIFRLGEYWAGEGCLIGLPYDVEKGAGTMNPLTFFRALGPEPWRVAYVEPSRRPADGRYGENPNRLFQHLQYQVVLKPSPDNVQDVYLGSLERLGIGPEHDVRFVEDNWEAPTLGAWGLGWEVWLDGMEITQFTYFQQMGGVELSPVSVEITYGLERITAYLQGVESVFDVKVSPDVTYRQLYLDAEYQQSRYAFEVADARWLQEAFTSAEAEARRALDAGLYLAAYDLALRCSHLFNLMDARRAVGVSERMGLIERIRSLTHQAATAHLARVEG